MTVRFVRAEPYSTTSCGDGAIYGRYSRGGTASRTDAAPSGICRRRGFTLSFLSSGDEIFPFAMPQDKAMNYTPTLL